MNDPVNIPFNNWLRANGIYVAIVVAVLLLTLVSIIYILSKNKKS